VSEKTEKLRVDKWLWHARFFKTRTLAAKVVSEGKVRVDSTRISKPSRNVGAGNTLTFAQGDSVRVVRIVAIGLRRGPAPEAQALYDDLSPPVEKRDGAAPQRVGARPTKRDRRRMDQNRLSDLE
jgi:ribosome-associated heat shock protein Hsp15